MLLQTHFDPSLSLCSSKKVKALQINKPFSHKSVVFLKSLHFKYIQSIQESDGINTKSGSLHLLVLNEPVLWLDIKFESFLTEVPDERTGQQGHAGDSYELQKSLPREQVIQRRHLRQHDARLHTDEVVR